MKKSPLYLEKPPIELLPPMAVLEAAKAMGFGVEKHGRGNFLNRPDISITGQVGKAGRHIFQWLSGKDLNTPENEVHHLGCAIADLMTALELIKRGSGIDDRDI